MQITTLSVRDFRGCREFECQPGERALVLVGGRNGAGKTSALNAIEWALLGPAAGPDEAVRRGADAAEVTVRMDGGAYTIMRRETAAGTRSFRVTAADGAVYPKPQAFLEKLIGTKFLDPVAFAAMKPAAQREALLKAVPVGIDLDANTAERKRAYEARTDVGRRLRDAEGEERALPEPVEPPTYEPETETSIADLMAALNAARGESDRQAGKRLALANAEHHHNRTEVEVDRLRRALAEAEAELVRSCALRDDLRAEVDAMTSPDVAAAERALAEVDETNRAIRARQAEHADIARRHREAAAARKAAAEKTSTLAGEQAALTARIEAL
ncbi:MAG: AAA family ATPase, partial [Gemmatimonadales bacterium]|nr:AAA family ATPase [Gemmatimonadales bacterium]